MERDDMMTDRASTIKDDVHDALDESKERMKAGAEKVKRTVQGDSMPLSDRIASHVKETGHDVKADFDHAKRDVRDHSDEDDI